MMNWRLLTLAVRQEYLILNEALKAFAASQLRRLLGNVP
jgi:hypothetical protein